MIRAQSLMPDGGIISRRVEHHVAASDELDDEVVVIGAGVAGIYQIKRLAELGVNATVLEAAPDLGGGTPKYVKRITEVREQD